MTFDLTIFADLYAYNRWANRRLVDLCRKVDDARLDREEPIGPGSLRKTLFHMWGAEYLWLERWRCNSPSSLPSDPNITVEELGRRFEAIQAERDNFLRSETAAGFQRIVAYRNLAGEAFSYPLASLLLHVANHGIHHRAQALQFLKLAGVTVPGGLDYIFHRIAFPTHELPTAGLDVCRSYGLEVATELVSPREFDRALLQQYGAYGDWGMERLFGFVEGLTDAELDRDFAMGMGTLRKTLLHIFDAENWWRCNWRDERKPFPKLPKDTSVTELRRQWTLVAADRRVMLADLDADGLTRTVEANFGAGVLPFRTGESLVQLCGHGTHHRAQAINMLRRLGHTPPLFDLTIWLKERAA